MSRSSIAIGAALVITVPLHIAWSLWGVDAPRSTCLKSAAPPQTQREERFKSFLSGPEVRLASSVAAQSGDTKFKRSVLTSDISTSTASDVVGASKIAPNKTASELLVGAFSTLADKANSDKNGVFTNPLAAWHKRAADDANDPNWSPMAQAQAESYLSETVSSDIELVSVKCTGSVCEIQAASTTAENSEKAANEWQASISAMSNESWWSTYGFAAPNSAIWAAPDGRALLVSYLTRVAP